MNKLISYLGFAKKSNNCVMGQTALKNNTKQLYLIIVDTSASENLINLAENLSKKQNCELIISKFPISDLIRYTEVKIIGLTDENLSKAIINNKERINID